MLLTNFWARYILYDTEVQSIEVGNLHILTLIKIFSGPIYNY